MDTPIGPPKNFVLRCPRCGFKRMSTGLTDDLKDLREVLGCPTCGAKRKFHCPKCGQTATLHRIKGNA